MDEWFKVIILGILEGITEFLPISSTGHLLVASRFLELPETLQGIFEIFIQSGAIIAVLIFYLEDIWYQMQHIHDDPTTQKLWLGIFVGFLPAGFLGFTLTITGILDLIFTNPYIVPIALIVGGILFLVAEHYIDDESAPLTINEHPPTYKQALIIGIWQTLALIPGMSRSGMSIIGGLLAGLDRSRATQFSFYLALPTLGGATVFSLVRSMDTLSPSDSFMLLLGMFVSAIISWISIRWLLQYIGSHSFVGFAYYRIVAGVIILILLVFS